MKEPNVSPERAFALLGNDTRVDIIQVLGEAQRESLSFSEIREQVGTQDSGQFNYHLNQLVGTFLRRDDDGRYELAYAGHRVVGAILSGEFDRGGTTNVFTLDSSCVTCNSPLEATYDDEHVSIRCPECDELRSHFSFPPGGFEDRSISELTSAFDSWIMGSLGIVVAGICFNCAGKTVGQLTDESELIPDEPVVIEFTCQRCGDTATLSVNSYLLFHPAVVVFHYDRGIDVREVKMWNLDFVLHPDLTIRSADPWEIESTLEIYDDRIILVVEEDLTVRVE